MNALRTSLNDRLPRAALCLPIFTLLRNTQLHASHWRLSTASVLLICVSSIVKFISIYRHTQLQDVPCIEVISLQDVYKRRLRFWDVMSGAGLKMLRGNLLSLLSECHIPEDNNIHALNYRTKCTGSQIFHNPKL